jgi:hypothetical protein
LVQWAFSNIEGGKSNQENELLGGDGPNGVFGVRRVGGEVSEGLHVYLPFIGNESVCGKSFHCDPIAFCKSFVAFFAEFLPRLGVDEFLEFGFKFFF